MGKVSRGTVIWQAFGNSNDVRYMQIESTTDRYVIDLSYPTKDVVYLKV